MFDQEESETDELNEYAYKKRVELKGKNLRDSTPARILRDFIEDSAQTYKRGIAPHEGI